MGAPGRWGLTLGTADRRRLLWGPGEEEALHWHRAYRVSGRSQVLAKPAPISWLLASVAGNRAMEVTHSVLASPGMWCGDGVWEGQGKDIRILPLMGLASERKRPRTGAGPLVTCYC